VDIDMDEELAWEMVRVSFRTASELQGLLGLLKENCSAEEYQVYARRIAQAIDAVNDALLNAAISAHPELATRIEADLAKFGHIG
jgi:hypothetical protein